MPDGTFPIETNLTSVVCDPTSPIATLMRTIGRIANSDATVLLTGETGTGKEVFAREVHEQYRRTTGASGAFVPVNCGAIPESLLEAELFGHAKGAFTGATCARKGRVAMAEGGTLFLDEIGELPLGPQVKLLRLLQERTYEPVGDAKTVRANFRLIAATNRDLREEVRAGRFREDLYYRLFVFPMELPALRERPMDVAPLLQHFWKRAGESRPFTDRAVHCLTNYPWPGNVRELENLTERLSVCAEGAVIDVADLPVHYRQNGQPKNTTSVLPMESIRDAAFAMAQRAPVEGAPNPQTGSWSGAEFPEPHFSTPVLMDAPAEPAPAGEWEVKSALEAIPSDLPRFLRDLEWSFIERALEETRGNKQAAARMLGLGRTTLVEKIRRRERDAKPARAIRPAAAAHATV